MINKFVQLILLVFILMVFREAQAQHFQLESLNKNILLKVDAEDSLCWSVAYRNKLVIDRTSIALQLHNQPYAGRKFNRAKALVSSHSSVIESVVANKDKIILDEYQQLTLKFGNEISVEFRVYNEGIAWRFVTGLDGNIEVTNEQMNLRFPAGTSTLFPQETSMYSHFERSYLLKSIDTITPGAFCSLPVLFTTPDSVRVVFTEADLYDYPCMFLKAAPKGLMQSQFPGYVLQTRPASRGSDRSQQIMKEADYIASTPGTRSFPWRVFVISDDDRALVESNLVYKLSRPLKLTETSWIKPGKVAWDWYNANILTNVDFKSGINTQTYKYYIDFAAACGLEYVILDEGWTKTTTNVLESDPEINIPELVSYAAEKKVGIILWLLWHPLDGNEEKILKTYHEWGIKGIKVDFMQRADQYMVNSYEKIAEVAANYELLVDFHGAFKPSGLSRAYPNVLSHEGVRGNENNKWSAYASPEHNVTLPFIRMVAGPMDYTPGAMRNAQKNDFGISFNNPVSLGTRCHQVAMYVVYESPLQMLCDSPSLYYKESQTTDFISRIPSVWDETIVLKASVGDYIIIARRKGEQWFIGAMTDWTPRKIEIDLSFLPEATYLMEVMKDGLNAEKNANDFKHEISEVNNDTLLTLELASGGGWTAILKARGKKIE
ncbi:MAG: glycoside hydrolase family 97 protein [Lentimicrobium sp.]|nr:glycoside hydrolase family 97 protein [Lentimicrobium sp.]